MKFTIQRLFVTLGILFLVKIALADQFVAKDQENLDVVKARMLSR